MRAEKKMDGDDVSIGIAVDSSGVREEASGELFPELLLCILDRFDLFVDGKDRNGSFRNGKESCPSVLLGLFRSWLRCSMKRS